MSVSSLRHVFPVMSKYSDINSQKVWSSELLLEPDMIWSGGDMIGKILSWGVFESSWDPCEE